MFNSIRHRTTDTASLLSEPIETGVIAHDSNLDRLSWLHHLWKLLAHHLTYSHEPHIWQEHSLSGQLVWRAYDPQTGRSARYHTAAEMIDWIEQRIDC